LEAQFPETAATQPELLAHHYTEAGLAAPAVGYWSGPANTPVTARPIWKRQPLDHGIELLKTLPETPSVSSNLDPAQCLAVALQ